MALKQISPIYSIGWTGYNTAVLKAHSPVAPYKLRNYLKCYELVEEIFLQVRHTSIFIVLPPLLVCQGVILLKCYRFRRNSSITVITAIVCETNAIQVIFTSNGNGSQTSQNCVFQRTTLFCKNEFGLEKPRESLSCIVVLSSINQKVIHVRNDFELAHLIVGIQNQVHHASP